MSSELVPVELMEARQEIDRIDLLLVDLLVERFALTHRIGVLKASKALQAVDSQREAQKLNELRALCEGNGLNPQFITDLFNRIMQEVVKNHQQLAEETKR